jgi:O-antigen/teichoic acid export membrane protein
MGLPLLPASVSLWTMLYLDRWFLARSVSPTDLGLYEVANRATVALGLVGTAFQAAWLPFAYHIERHKDAQQTYSVALRYYGLLMLGASLAFGLFAPELFALFLPSTYAAAAPLAALLAYVPVAQGTIVVLTTGPSLARSTAAVALALCGAAVLHVVLDVLLIAVLGWGTTGAALATISAFLVAVAVLYVGSQRVYPIPYDSARVLRILLIHVCLLSTFLISVPPAWTSLLLRAGLLASYPVLVLVGRCLDPVEDAWLRRQWSALVRSARPRLVAAVHVGRRI